MAFRSGLDPEHVAAEVRPLVRPADQQAAVTLLSKVRGDGWDVAADRAGVAVLVIREMGVPRRTAERRSVIPA